MLTFTPEQLRAWYAFRNNRKPEEITDQNIQDAQAEEWLRDELQMAAQILGAPYA